MADPETLLDRYELRELIGAGGSARVYRALDRTLHREVAVKMLDSAVARSADPASHARFLREGRSSARFSHPHAVAVYDAGDDAGRLFIVMEYVDGGSLAERIAADAPIADRHVVRVGTQLLSALGAAHAAGIVHRDVKPANVLLDRNGTVKLADFGIARRFDEITSALTVEGMVMGTRAYLAPEQARGVEVGPAADLYAVGAVLYEMATGERPPMTPVDADRGADPRALCPQVSPAVAAAISTALSGRPEHRFRSAAEMTAALAAPSGPAEGSTASVGAGAAPTALAPTAAMPAAAAPTAATRTAPIAPSGRSATAVMPAAPSVEPARIGGRWWFVVVVALLAIAGVVTALALTGSPESQSSGPGATQPVALPPATGAAVATTTPLATSVPETTVPPTTAAATTAPTTPPTTAPPTTAPPTTPPPTTAPPTTPPVDELIPGFRATDDVEQFIDQLRDRKSTAGKQSKKLGDGLRDVVRADDDRDEKIEDLVDKLDEWLEKEEIDPVVAVRAVEFFAELAADDG